MSQITSVHLRGVATDISTELANLDRLAADVAAVRQK
jgi:hypothetical protein